MLVRVLLFLFEERDGVLAPVAARVQVVAGVVAVVVAVAVGRRVDQGDAAAEVRVGLDFVDEGVLAPVPRHERDAH